MKINEDVVMKTLAEHQPMEVRELRTLLGGEEPIRNSYKVQSAVLKLAQDKKIYNINGLWFRVEDLDAAMVKKLAEKSSGVDFPSDKAEALVRRIKRQIELR